MFITGRDSVFKCGIELDRSPCMDYICIWFLFLVSSCIFVSVPCARLSWPFRQLLSARKYIVSYRTTKSLKFLA